MLYFIQSGDGGLIKIGHTAGSPRQRLSALQGASVERLDLLGCMDGDRPEESALHERFAAHRVQREWFLPVPELLEFIRENAAERAARVVTMGRLSFRCERDLVRRVDEARGGIPRERFLRDVVTAALLEANGSTVAERAAQQVTPARPRPQSAAMARQAALNKAKGL